MDLRDVVELGVSFHSNDDDVSKVFESVMEEVVISGIEFDSIKDLEDLMKRVIDNNTFKAKKKLGSRIKNKNETYTLKDHYDDTWSLSEALK